MESVFNERQVSTMEGDSLGDLAKGSITFEGVNKCEENSRDFKRVTSTVDVFVWGLNLQGKCYPTGRGRV